MADERTFYEPLKASLKQHIEGRLMPNYHDQRLQIIARLRPRSERVYLEITADSGLGNELKSRISQQRDLIYHFLGKKERPDITGFLEIDPTTAFIALEFKDEKLKLDHIYQLKKYADLLDSKYSLLISTAEIPVEIKRLKDNGVIPDLLSRSAGYNSLTLVHYDSSNHKFLDWFPEDPFPRWREDPKLTPKLDVKLEPPSQIKQDWEIPFVIKNDNEFPIMIYQILVNGHQPDGDQIQLNLGGDEMLSILRFMSQDGESYLYEAAPHSSHRGKLIISKRWFGAMGELDLELVLKDQMRYPAGSFRLS